MGGGESRRELEPEEEHKTPAPLKLRDCRIPPVSKCKVMHIEVKTPNVAHVDGGLTWMSCISGYKLLGVQQWVLIPWLLWSIWLVIL